MNLPQVTNTEVSRFAQQWRSRGGTGISIVLDQLHAEFTRDFVNMVLIQAYGDLVEQHKEALKPKVILTES